MMDAVVEHVRTRWASEGAEVTSAGRTSVTVAMPHEFRELDAALLELVDLFGVSVDLELTAAGAVLNIQRTRFFSPAASPQRFGPARRWCTWVMAPVGALVAFVAWYVSRWAFSA